MAVFGYTYCALGTKREVHCSALRVARSPVGRQPCGQVRAESRAAVIEACTDYKGAQKGVWANAVGARQDWLPRGADA